MYDQDQEQNSPSLSRLTSARLSFNSRDDLSAVIQKIDEGIPLLDLPSSAYSIISEICTKSDGDSFVSLTDRIRDDIISSFPVTKGLDEDGEILEPFVEDSIIADFGFSSVLNENRIVQVSDTIYRYLPFGLIYTTNHNPSSLDIDMDSLLAISANVTSLHNKVKDGVYFISSEYQRVEYFDNVFSSDVDEPLAKAVSYNKNYTLSGTSLTIPKVTTIPSNKIKDLNYDRDNEGGWLHSLFTGLFGTNCVAYKDIKSRRRMRMNFYDQDYYIYHNIGTKVNMQKKVIIWWNTNADVIYQGCSAIEILNELQYSPYTSFPKDPIAGTATEYLNQNRYPVFMRRNFPFSTNYGVETLINVPIVDYSITTQNVNDLYWSLVSEALKKVPNYIIKQKNKDLDTPVGFFSIKYPRTFCTLTGPFTFEPKYKTTNSEHKFFSKWFPRGLVLGITLNGSIGNADVSYHYPKMDDKSMSTRLGRGIVYGAVKYDGIWVACRIVKTSFNK